MTKITGPLHEGLCKCMIISRSVLLRMGNVSGKDVEKIKTHILGSITFSRRTCRLWGNVEKYGRSRQATDDSIVQRMRVACWITKATEKCSEYVIIIALSLQQWLRERASMLRLSIYCLSCFHNHDLIDSLLFILLRILHFVMKVIVSRMMRWSRHAACMGKFSVCLQN